MTTDTIADLLTRIRNAGQRKLQSTLAPNSKMSLRIVEILEKEKFINGFEIIDDPVSGHKRIKIMLRYANGVFVMQNLKRISKPGIRTYTRYHRIPKVLGGHGICILSTSMGVMTGREAREKKIGGELLCTIY